MPATLVHPAAVLPFCFALRKWLPVSALVIGSLTPDFEYLVRWGAGNRFSHTLSGLYFCVPAGLVAFLLFHVAVKRPMFEILPEALRGRLLPLAWGFRWLPWWRLPLIVLAVALGAFTHQAWDSFTHYGAWGTKLFPRLEHLLFTVGDLRVRGYGLLQYLGTPVGLAVLASALWWWLRRTPAGAAPPSFIGRRDRAAIWAGLVLVPLMLGMAHGLTMMGPHRGAFGLRQLVAGAAMGAHAGLYAALLAYGVGVTIWQWRPEGPGNKIPAGGGEQGP
ncbi:MAG TPA: DUF4184 family protein [Planctomycetota bacterium]|nr:DUF4184 family protein [Planctomycetota bacterium]